MLLRQLVEFITPAECLGCGREGAWICANCLASAPTQAPACFRCGQPQPGGRTCPSCRPDSALHGATVGAYYDGAVKDLVLKLKFERSAAAASELADLLAAHLDAAGYDLVTAVPIAPRRYRERGYNQSELIARALGLRLRLPFRSTLLRDSSDHQLGRGRHERLEQIRGAFRPLGHLSGERVLLVDDVLTTGATLDEAARELQLVGAASVWAAVVARH
jgi:ComF family protein